VAGIGIAAQSQPLLGYVLALTSAQISLTDHGFATYQSIRVCLQRSPHAKAKIMSNSQTTALRSALERAGIVPRLQQTDVNYGERSAVTFADTSQLSDEQIVEELSRTKIDVADIVRQLNDDKEDGIKRGEVWRAKAKRAKRGKSVRIDQLTEEARRRGLVAAFPDVAAKVAEREALGRAQIAIEEQRSAKKLEVAQAHRATIEAAMKAKASLMEQQNRRNVDLCQMFMKAAYSIFSLEECSRVWNKAREMFPTDPAWLNFPPSIKDLSKID
jgi:hypothetical protein